MSKREQYFLKQKLIGVTMIIGSIILALLIKEEAIVIPIICVPLGLILLFEKSMVWIDNFYYEENSKEDRELL